MEFGHVKSSIRISYQSNILQRGRLLWKSRLSFFTTNVYLD